MRGLKTKDDHEFELALLNKEPLRSDSQLLKPIQDKDEKNKLGFESVFKLLQDYCIKEDL